MVNKHPPPLQYTSASGSLSWILSSVNATSRAGLLFSQTKPEINHSMVIRAEVGNSGWLANAAFLLCLSQIDSWGSRGAFCQMRNSCSVTAVGQEGSGVARFSMTARCCRVPSPATSSTLCKIPNFTSFKRPTRFRGSESCWDDPWSVSPWRTVHTAAAALRGLLIELFAGVKKKKSDLLP